MAVPQRIVSLLPSSTEILCALGLEASLVGISHACDYPPGVASLPCLTAPSSGNAGEGHKPDREMAVVQAGLSIYRLNVELLRVLHQRNSLFPWPFRVRYLTKPLPLGSGVITSLTPQ